MASGAVRHLTGKVHGVLNEQVCSRGYRFFLSLDCFGEGVKLLHVELADGDEAIEVGLPLDPQCNLAVVL